MELFSEIYGLYFRAVEALLRRAETGPVTEWEARDILTANAFSESAYYIWPKLQDGTWPLLREADGGYSTTLSLPEDAPLTRLQRSWLRAVLDDPRMALFLEAPQQDSLRQTLTDVEPLYRQADFYCFDSAADGDDFASPAYRSIFRAFLTAIREQTALVVCYNGGKGHRMEGLFWPRRLEYSPKDDKFRAHCYRRSGQWRKYFVLNLARVESAAPARNDPEPLEPTSPNRERQNTIELEITSERNALERAMLQFAHFDKRTEYDPERESYHCELRYNASDETEVLIRVLSFGPTLRVLGPDSFLRQVRARVARQTELLNPSAPCIPQFKSTHTDTASSRRAKARSI